MKILLIDSHPFQTLIRKTLIEEELKCNVDTIATLIELYDIFKKNLFDVVVIDHSTENAQEHIEYLFSIDSLQQILVISNMKDCIINECKECIQFNRIRRLNNPTSIPNILRMIRNFEYDPCDHYHLN